MSLALLLLIVLMGFLVAGCSSGVPVPTRGSQGLYEGEASFIAVLKVANAYAALPRCASTVKPPCSEQAIINQASVAAAKADVAVQAARKVAKDSTSTDAQINSAGAAANTAILALLQIIPSPQ